MTIPFDEWLPTYNRISFRTLSKPPSLAGDYRPKDIDISKRRDKEISFIDINGKTGVFPNIATASRFYKIAKETLKFKIAQRIKQNGVCLWYSNAEMPSHFFEKIPKGITIFENGEFVFYPMISKLAKKEGLTRSHGTVFKMIKFLERNGIPYFLGDKNDR